jgi:hypothetical protein
MRLNVRCHQKNKINNREKDRAQLTDKYLDISNYMLYIMCTYIYIILIYLLKEYSLDWIECLDFL